LSTLISVLIWLPGEMILAETKEKYQIGDNLNESVHLR
jgi:hypothetical protein